MRNWEELSMGSTQPVGYFFTRSDFELMQFTGLTDKNGKEIYEGDIIKESSGQSYRVVFEAPSFKKACESGAYNLQATQYLEVIGNIYETPDLVK